MLSLDGHPVLEEVDYHSLMKSIADICSTRRCALGQLRYWAHSFIPHAQAMCGLGIVVVSRARIGSKETLQNPRTEGGTPLEPLVHTHAGMVAAQVFRLRRMWGTSACSDRSRPTQRPEATHLMAPGPLWMRSNLPS